MTNIYEIFILAVAIVLPGWWIKFYTFLHEYHYKILWMFCSQSTLGLGFQRAKCFPHRLDFIATCTLHIFRVANTNFLTSSSKQISRSPKNSFWNCELFNLHILGAVSESLKHLAQLIKGWSKSHSPKWCTQNWKTQLVICLRNCHFWGSTCRDTVPDPPHCWVPAQCSQWRSGDEEDLASSSCMLWNPLFWTTLWSFSL